LRGQPCKRRKEAILRKYFPISGAIVLLCLLLASSTSAFRPSTPFRPDPCYGKSFTAKQFEPFASRVWSPKRWERGAPKAKTIAAEHHWITCAAGPGHVKAIKRIWRKTREGYFDRRRLELWRAKVTPYDCGGGTRSAIKCSIMWCESGGSYTARNPSSSAGGKYQVLDTTWAAYGGRPYADSHPAAVAPPAEQDRIAAAIWADVGASAWVCT
jgi:hypothetical protein